MELNKILRPDSKGRVCLGKFTSGISGYKAVINEETKEITLKPYTEIPLSENWLYQNKSAFNSVTKGMEDSERGRVVDKGTFTSYIE